jgi:hypothetical protein
VEVVFLASRVELNGRSELKGFIQMSEHYLFALPALTAILIQGWLFLNSDKRNLINKNLPFLLLFISLFGISSIELLTYTETISPNLTVIKFYYVFCFLGINGILIQSLKLSGIKSKKIEKKAILALASFCIFVSFLMLNTNIFISGFEHISYSYTRIPGDYYWIIQTYFAFSNIFTIFFLIRGMKNKTNFLYSKKAKVLFYSLFPLLITGILLIPLMQIGIKINASIIFPILICYFLLIFIHTEKEEAIFSLLIKLPFTRERYSLKLINCEIQKFLVSTDMSKSFNDTRFSASLKALTNTIENILVEHAVDLSHGSQIKAASLLGISSSTICRKRKEIKI